MTRRFWKGFSETIRVLTPHPRTWNWEDLGEGAAILAFVLVLTALISSVIFLIAWAVPG